MKPRTKFLIGGAVVLGVAAYLAVTSIKETGVGYYTPSELSAKLQADSSFRNVGVKVGARVVPGTVTADPGGKRYAFQVTDGAHTFPVVYRGIAPDTFTDSVDVVVGGRMGADGTFQATELLAKCASRYENAPTEQKYKQTPGYKAVAGANRA
jgi:cytochrome c-type biogenesis protein CcmE